MRVILYIALIFSSLTLSAQHFKSLNGGNAAYAFMGDEYFDNGQYLNAIYCYEKLLSIDSSDINMRWKVGLSYLKLKYFKKALYHLEMIPVTDDDEESPYYDVLYHKAYTLKCMGKYDKAFEIMRSYVKYHSDKSNPLYKQGKFQTKTIQKLRNSNLNGIQEVKAKQIIKNDTSEISPILFNDSTLLLSVYQDHEEKEKQRIYPKTVQIWGNSKGASKFFEAIDTSNFHAIANISFTPDTTGMYFTSIIPETKKTGIYFSEDSAGTWLAPKLLPEPINVEDYNTSQLQHVKFNGLEYLLFSSDRERGKGGMDLWFIEIKKGKMKKPRNIKKANTPGEEITPFYDMHNKLLYYSSNYKDNYGNYDIFQSLGVNLKKVKVGINMGPEINSAYNELYFTRYSNNVAYFTSNKLEGSPSQDDFPCCMDVYQVEFPIDTGIKDTPLIAEEPQSILEDQNIALYFPNDYPNPRSVDTTTSENYLASYLKYQELLPEYIKNNSKRKNKQEKQAAADALQEFYTEQVKGGVDNLQEFTQNVLELLLTGDKTIDLTIKGYASPLAKSDYNERLTKRRIASFVNYLTEYQNGALVPFLEGTNKINSQLIVHKIPFGEEKASDATSDNLNDKQKSVYSVDAALERKIEIISATVKENE